MCIRDRTYFTVPHLHREDNRKKAAEQKKDRVREQVRRLREDYAAFVGANEGDAVPEQRLPRSQTIIDPVLEESLAEEGKSKLEEVRLVMEWECERKRLRLEKLQRTYLDSLVVESISLRAFRTDHSVSSFRTLALDPAPVSYTHLTLPTIPLV